MRAPLMVLESELLAVSRIAGLVARCKFRRGCVILGLLALGVSVLADLRPHTMHTWLIMMIVATASASLKHEKTAEIHACAAIHFVANRANHSQRGDHSRHARYRCHDGEEIGQAWVALADGTDDRINLIN